MAVDPVTGALISGGIKAVGGLLGRGPTMAQQFRYWQSQQNYGAKVNYRLTRRTTMFQNRQREKYEDRYFKRLRKNAEAGGFHPLAALGGYGPGGMVAPASITGTGRAPVASSAGIQNAFDAVADALSGTWAAESARQKTQTEVAEINEDIQRRKVSTQFGTQPVVDGPAQTGDGGDRRTLMQRLGENDPTNPYLLWTEDGTAYVGSWEDYPKIPLSTSWGENIMIPANVAYHAGLSYGSPLTAEFAEDVAGDELGQALFGDWLATNGISIRGYDTEVQQQTIKTALTQGLDAARNFLGLQEQPEVQGSPMGGGARPRNTGISVQEEPGSYNPGPFRRRGPLQ